MSCLVLRVVMRLFAGSWINNLLRKGEVRPAACPRTGLRNYLATMQFKVSVSGTLSNLDDGKAFCYSGGPLLSLEGLRTLWTDLQVNVTFTPKDGLVIGRGNSSKQALSGDILVTGQKSGIHIFSLSVHAVDCVGLVPEVRDHIEYQLKVRKRLAYERLLLLVAGLALLVAAPRLSR